MQTQSILCRAHVDAIREAIESWKVGQNQSQTAREVEDLVQECLRSHELLKGWYERACQSYRTGELDGHLLSTAECFRSVFANFRDLLPRIQELIRRNGDDQEAQRQIQEVAASVERTLVDLKKWPVIDHEMIAKSLAEFERGEYFTGEQVFRELLGEE